MKKIIWLALLFILGLNYLTAQNDQNKHENFKAYKIAYLTQELDLTPKEAEIFWPLYNAYGKKVYELKVAGIRNQKRQINEKGGIDSLDEKDANKYIANLIENEEEFVKLKKEFYNELKNVLTANKILKLYNAENEFNRRLLSEFRRRKGNPSN